MVVVILLDWQVDVEGREMLCILCCEILGCCRFEQGKYYGRISC